MVELIGIETLGYIGSFIIAISIVMNSILKLRIINMIGAILLGTYGLYLESMPIVYLNYFIAAVNVYYLAKHYVLCYFNSTKSK